MVTRKFASLKPLAKGAMSRKIAVAVRRTYVKSSIIRALTATILRETGHEEEK